MRFHIAALAIALVTAACSAAPTAGPSIQVTPLLAYNDRSDPIAVLASNVDALNQKDFARAYGYWETPPNGQTLDQYAAGFATTESVELIVGPPVVLEGAAGSVFGSIRTVLIGTQTDGTRQTFSGCYVVRRLNMGTNPETNPWSISRATIAAQANDADIPTLLRQACPTSG